MLDLRYEQYREGVANIKTLKIMSLIGIVLGVIAFVCVCAFSDPYNYVSAVGWGIYASLYLTAFGIVGLVQAIKNWKE